MPDYGHQPEFGYFLVPDASDPGGVLETAVLADRLGYDLLGVQDHPYQRRHLDTLALLGVVLARTRRIRVFQAVGNLPLRPPAVFAKAAATLDQLSGGRFEAGLGAGGYLGPAHAMGAPALTPGESLEALDEAVAIMDLGFSDFILVAPPDPDTLQTFIEDVAPEVRERVAQARARVPSAAQERSA
jgi:alkanesulfonate monooxygenase SsuD/methylene tetrahydromethanopterin reductase-like flavin-dependent oxidoreductase (luciferase family)